MLIALDLDGTLNFENGQLAKGEMERISLLTEAGHCCVLLTGRNLLSLKKALPKEVAFQYIGYSSGAGILTWPEEQHLFQALISPQDTNSLTAFLQEKGHSFFLQCPLPENQRNLPMEGENPPEDFFRRKDRYKTWEVHSIPPRVSQFLVILSHTEEREELIETLSSRKESISLIKTTSPMDHRTPWLEIFPKSVDKGTALKRICQSLGMKLKDSISLGNDWNDEAMLKTAGQSWIVPNSPEELQQCFPVLRGKSLSSLENLIQALGLV